MFAMMHQPAYSQGGAEDTLAFRVRKRTVIEGLYSTDSPAYSRNTKYLKFFPDGRVMYVEASTDPVLLNRAMEADSGQAHVYRGQYRVDSDSVFFNMERSQLDYPMHWKGRVSGDTLDLIEQAYDVAGWIFDKSYFDITREAMKSSRLIYSRMHFIRER